MPSSSSSHPLLNSVLADVTCLIKSYRRAGLLGAPTDVSAPTAALHTLVGERGEALAFQRRALLADALLRNTIAWQVLGRAVQPRHAVVFGGTQVGKSTCVNVLLGHNAARVHHLGGFTRHAQAFVPADVQASTLFAHNPHAFPEFSSVPLAQLQPDVLNAFSVQPLREAGRVPNLVVWDAPDCDAIGSTAYLPALIEVLSLADAVVYVTTKEKYSVDSILEWVVELTDAGMSLVTCLNNTPPRQQADVLRSQQDAFNVVGQRQGKYTAQLNVIAFPAVPAETSEEVISILSDPQFAPGLALCQATATAAASSRAQRARTALAFVQTYLPEVLRPALVEAESLADWKDAVDAAIGQFVSDYTHNYLDDPKHYDSFTRVSLRILDLLNLPIPGLSETLRNVRAVVRLPARAVFWVGKKAWQFAFGNGKKEPSSLPLELKTYADAHVALLNTLSQVIRTQRSRTRHHPFWDELDATWDAELAHLQIEFQTKLDAHWQETERRIEETAHAIYTELEKKPAQLNLLRASRFGADVTLLAGSLVATLSGGIIDATHILEELIVAPAMLSFVEFLSEALTRNFVETRKAEFKTQLLADSKKFVEDVYRPTMTRLAEAAIQKAGFVDMDAESLRTLPARLNQLEGMLI